MPAGPGADIEVRSQMFPEDVAQAAAAGFRGIINNRPDGEELGQPTSLEIEAEARRRGLAYWHIPIVPGQATEGDAQAFLAALRAADGPVIAFCRTGNRSAALWQLAQRSGAPAA